MATWVLTTQHKKNAIERSIWYKDGKKIVQEQGFRWGKFYCESDEKPDVDLKNPDGYEISGYDWEMDSMDDGCWLEWEWPEDMTEEEQDKIMDAWGDDFYDGMEALGWSNDDTEYVFYGPLQLENEQTGEVFQGEPDE